MHIYALSAIFFSARNVILFLFLPLLTLPFYFLFTSRGVTNFMLMPIAAEVKPSKEHAGATLEVPSEEILPKSV